MRYPWQDIEYALHTLTAVEGGYSAATRGIITLPHKTTAFAKIGTDDNSRTWTQREVQVYQVLHEHNYAHIPQLLSYSDDHTGLAIEALSPSDGWDWSANWTPERLVKTIEAMEELAAIEVQDKNNILYTAEHCESDIGWLGIYESPEKQRTLQEKLREHSVAISVENEYERSLRFTHRADKLIHNDVRADNCAWHAERGEVRFVDWNWAEYGDFRITINELLVHVHRNGLDVTKYARDHLDIDTLHKLTGRWFLSATKPYWGGGAGDLREKQLLSGIAAWRLLKEIEND